MTPDTVLRDLLNPQWITLAAIVIYGVKTTRTFARLEMKVDLLWKQHERARGLDGQHE